MVRLVSSVRFRQGARRRSSVGQSTRLIIELSSVQVRPPLPKLPDWGQLSPTQVDPQSDQRRKVDQRGPVPKNEKRVKVTLACDVCKRRNYITMKNRQNDRERIEMKKYCRWDRQHTLHKETR